MASLKELKDRIGSVKSTQKITKAKQMVAAAKLRRAQEAAEAARPYAERLEGVMSSLASKVSINSDTPKLLAGTGKSEHHLMVVATSDRGLCGAFNTNIVKEARQKADELIAGGKKVTFYLIGKKAKPAIKRVYPNYDAEAGHELAGFVWFQGWNDMVDGGVYPNRGKPGGYDQYSEVLAHFIRDVRKELEAPDMPFVIGVMGVNGPIKKYDESQQRYAGVHGGFRDAMAAPASLPEFKDNVTAVRTENYWDQELGELSKRWGKVNGESRKLRNDKSLTDEARKTKIDAFTNELFTTEELKMLEVGKSNAEYHYLGSGKIMAQIGKAFAEAIHGFANWPSLSE